MTTPFVLCADDYGMSPGVSEAICLLLQQGRLSATSCMAVAPLWPEHAGWLRQARGAADVGLHLTLTEYAPLTAMPKLAPDGRLPALPRLMQAAYLGGLARSEIAAELGRQLDVFEDAYGGPPSFLDGHQHVHQLPVVRDVVLELLRDRLSGDAYLRTCWDSPAAIVRRGVATAKTLLIAGLGVPLRRKALRDRVATNSVFRGVYDFSRQADYPALFERFLRDMPAKALVMCHPGLHDPAWREPDVIAEQRVAENAFFQSERMPEALARNGLRLAPFLPAAG